MDRAELELAIDQWVAEHPIEWGVLAAMPLDEFIARAVRVAGLG